MFEIEVEYTEIYIAGSGKSSIKSHLMPHLIHVGIFSIKVTTNSTLQF